MKQEIGALLHLYLDEIQAGEATEIHEFLVQGAARAIQEADDRNWIPLIVKQTDIEEYQVIANDFIYAAAQEAGLDKVWCIVADDSEIVKESSQILAQEKISKVNLAKASRDQGYFILKMRLSVSKPYLQHRSA